MDRAFYAKEPTNAADKFIQAVKAIVSESQSSSSILMQAPLPGKADIRNPLRYLLMNRSRFQRLLSRGFKPLLRQSTFGPPPTPLRRGGGGLIVRFKFLPGK